MPARARFDLLLHRRAGRGLQLRGGGSYTPTFVSENIKRVLGYEPDQYLKDPEFWRVARASRGSRRRSRRAQAKLFEEGRHVAEYRFRKADGIYCWVSDEQHLVKDQNGNPLEVIGSWSEVTARKTAEQAALAQSEQRLTDAIDTISEGFSLYDNAGPAGARQPQICRAVRPRRRCAEARHDLRGDHPQRGRRTA